METFKEALKCRTKLIKESSLAGPLSVATILRRPQKPKHGVCRWVRFEGVIRMIFAGRVRVCANVTNTQSAKASFEIEINETLLVSSNDSNMTWILLIRIAVLLPKLQLLTEMHKAQKHIRSRNALSTDIVDQGQYLDL